MSNIIFFEQLAGLVHHQTEINDLVNRQSEKIKTAFLSNNSALLRDQFMDTTTYLANTTKVVSIT